MAITVEARSSLISLAVGMFNAAPGTAVLSDLTNAFEAGQTLKQIATNLAGSAEYKSIYPDLLTNAEFATKLVDNMVGSLVSAAGKADAVALITGLLNAQPTVTAAQKAAARADVTITAINALKAVPTTDATFGAARVALDNKVAVATYHSVDKLGATTTLAQLQNVIASVTNTDASVTAAKSTIDGNANVGQSLSFTTGIDNLVGAAGNDTFNAVITSTSAVLGALDKADGGAGTDTINIQDTSVAAGADFNLTAFNGLTLSNIEVMNVTANGAIGTAGGTAFDVSTISGLTSFVGAAAGAGTATGSKVKAAGTTDVALTVAGANSAEVEGGKAVTINAGTGVSKVTGTALTSVTLNKAGAGSNVSNDTSTTAGAGTTLKSVTLTSVSGATTVAGRGVESLTLSGATTGASSVTVTNSSTEDISNFTINASGTGFTTTATAVTTVVHNDTKALTLNLTGTTNNLEIDSTTATTLTIAGSGRVALTDAAGLTAVKTISGSASTGNLTLGTLNALVTSVTTGSGNDSLTLAATAKATVDTGAGDDTLTLGSAVAAGSSINLGAGNDKVLAGTGSVATSTATDITTIDGGAGFDTASASLINAANATRFVNFEALDLSAAVTNLDVDLMTGSKIESLTLTGKAAATTSQVSNVAAGVSLKVSGDNSAGVTATINVKNAATTTTDTFTIQFDGAARTTAATAATVKAGTVVLNNIETITIDSVGGANNWNSVAVTDDRLKTLNITGSQNLDLTFVGTNGTNAAAGGAVKLIDGSTATGRLNINTTNVTADSASTGLTVNGGSGNDTITLVGHKATVVAGAGDDTIVVAATFGGTLTGGAGKDKFDVQAAVATAATEAGAVLTTITDFSAGDSIKLLATAAAYTSAKITLTSAVTNIVDALGLATATANQVTWFNYGTDTYVVSNDATVGLGAGDLVVKLTGTIDLTNATLDTTTDFLSLA